VLDPVFGRDHGEGSVELPLRILDQNCGVLR
jgi:hypothetical protein